MMPNDVVDKIIKEVKNEGMFLSLVKKAAAELEEDGYIDSLRNEGRQLSDAIFRRHLTDNLNLMDFNKDLKEKVFQEHKAYANRKELLSSIEAKVREKFTLNWFEKHAKNVIEDKIRRELGLPLLHANNKKEEPDIDEEWRTKTDYWCCYESSRSTSSQGEDYR